MLSTGCEQRSCWRQNESDLDCCLSRAETDRQRDRRTSSGEKIQLSLLDPLNYIPTHVHRLVRPPYPLNSEIRDALDHLALELLFSLRTIYLYITFYLSTRSSYHFVSRLTSKSPMELLTRPRTYTKHQMPSHQTAGQILRKGQYSQQN